MNVRPESDGAISGLGDRDCAGPRPLARGPDADVLIRDGRLSEIPLEPQAEALSAAELARATLL